MRSIAPRRISKGALLAVGLLGCLLMEQQTVASPERTKTENGPERHGNVEGGRNVFNGKGICHYCHGINGYRDNPPQLAPDTAALIARLDPPPADLRNPKTLRLKSDKARAKAIREGHPGTGMFPTRTLTNRELTDTLSYLAALRKEGHTGSDSEPPLMGDSTRGEELYEASCVVCHGSRAMGGIGPRLAGNPVLASDQAFWKIVHEGRHVMPPLENVVTDQQLADIRAWLRTLP